MPARIFTRFVSASDQNRNSTVKKLPVVLLCIALAIGAPVCKVSKTRVLDRSAIGDPRLEKIVGITTQDGREVKFDPPGASVTDQTLRAAVQRQPYEISLNEVQRYWVVRKETSTARTLGLTAAVVGGTVVLLAAIAIATKNSCPFVYSWNGNEYVFDAEPYGGAITRGLERDDYSELENLKVVDGRYDILITNEVPETQYTNLMELQAVDHPAGTRVVRDDAGRFYTLSSPQRLISALDHTGRDLRHWLESTDRLIWEPETRPGKDGRLYNEVILTFPKPTEARRLKLVANVATGLWGSYMIKELLKLRGRDLEAYYEKVDSDPAQAELTHAWSLREQLYALELSVEEPDGWHVRGALLGGGPFIAEERVTVLDVSRVSGDEVKIKIRPPVGFWALNSFLAEYSEEGKVTVTSVKPASARDKSGRNILQEISKVDGDYYAMPVVGDRAWVSFPALPEQPGVQRTIFLHSRGYYRLHLEGAGEPDNRMLQEVREVPGAAVRMAARLFGQWKADRLISGN